MAAFSTIAAVGLGVAGLATQVRGQNNAVDAAERATQTSDATTRYIYDDTVRRNQYREGMGNAALAQLGGMYGLGNAQPTGVTGLPPFGGGGGFNPGTLPSGFGGFGGSTFNPQEYLDANPNLANAYRPGLDGFGNIYDWARAHWINHGQGEGRPSGQDLTTIPGAGLNTSTDATEAATSANPFQSFYDSPDYQLAFDEGVQALEGSAAARGGLLSGATGKALFDYGADRATTTFGNYKNTLNNIAGLGQQANNAITNAGQQYATQFGNNQALLAQVQGNAATNNANAIGGALGGFASGILRPTNGQERMTSTQGFI